MLRKIFISTAAAAVICGAASAAYAAEADIVKITHQNVAGSQTCYSGDDLIETEITQIPEVYFGMRINKPVFRVYVKLTAPTAGEIEIRTEQYNAKGRLLDTATRTISAAAGENEYSVELDHVRNAASMKVYADGEYIGGIGSGEQQLTLSEYPADYEIYQRGADNTAAVTFAGHISDPQPIAPYSTAVTVWSDGTVHTGFDSGRLYAAHYNGDGALASLETAELVNGGAKLEKPELGMKLFIWDDKMKPLCGICEVESYAPDDQKPVTVTVNGAEYTALPDEDGNFSLELTLEPGLYDASLEYAEFSKEFRQFGVGDIWVAAGQSNMTDMGALTSGYDYAAEDPVPDGVHIIYPEDVTWQKMTHPAGEGRFFKTGIRTSPVTSFARELNEAVGVPIGIVQSSVGGTNIYQWAEGVRPGDENDGYLGSALRACFDNKASTGIKGIIWYQGCNDTMNENYAYNYESLCETLFAQFRDFFGEDTPIITTQINDANQDSTSALGYYDAWSYVKDVQRRYPETHENVYVTGTGAYDLGDTIHNSAKSNLRVGGAWAKTALNKVYGMTDVVCEHPTVDSVTVTGDSEITIVFKNVGAEGLYLREDNKYLAITNGLVTIPLGDLSKEFTVRMGGNAKLTASNSGKGTEVGITSAELVNGSTVVLTTAEKLNGNVAVDCCYGKRFVPTLTDKATGWSALAFYNVMARYPDASEPQTPVEYTAADTAYINQGDDTASSEKMYLNYYKDSVGYPVMKFDLSALDKEHIQSASLNIYTNAIDKDRKGNITISQIGTGWDSTASYSTFSYSPAAEILSAETNTAGMFPVGSYSDIDITDFVKTVNGETGIGISCTHAAVCDMAGISSADPPKITVQYGSIVTLSAKDEDGTAATGVKLTISGLRSTQYAPRTFTTDENGEVKVVLVNGNYSITTAAGAYAAYECTLSVNNEDKEEVITLSKNTQTPVSVVISGGETEVRESQSEKTLAPFTATAYDADGAEVAGAEWSWSVTPEIKAVVTDGVVTTNSHAVAGDTLTLTATATMNGVSAWSYIEINIVEAGDITYSFDAYQISKTFDTSDASDVSIGKQGITASVSSAGNYSNIAVISSSDKGSAGYFPYGTGFVTSGYYLFLGAGGNSGTVTFAINLPEPAPSGKYLNIRYAKPYSTNNGTTKRTVGAANTITAGSSVIDVEASCADYDKWYATSIQLDSGVRSLSVQLGKWAGLAIEYISVTAEPASDGNIVIPEGTDAVKLMCLGDSITDGFTVAGAYRNRLCDLILSDGLSEGVDLVGSCSNGTGYDQDHEGHSGYAIAKIPASEDCEGRGRNGLYESVDSWLAVSTPDIVLLQIGTNDILSLYDLENAKSRLEALVERVKAKTADGGRIYLATIPYIAEDAVYNKTGKSQAELDALVNAYNEGVREIAGADDAVILADINSALTLSDLKDGIHPNADGYAKMGDYWYSLIKDYLAELLTK